MLIASGHHMEAIKEYLGHSTIRVTSDRYGHLFGSVREALRQDLDRLFEGASEGSAT
jgi:integrase